MKHIHLAEVDSTQSYLISLKKANYLISCRKQLSGHGRQNNQWIHFKNALAFSFSCTIDRMTLPMHVASILAKYFQLQIKWPNDLMKDGKKCAGIICQKIGEISYIGIGINWGRIDPAEIPNSLAYPITSLYEYDLLEQDYKRLAAELTDHVVQKLPLEELAELNDHLLFLDQKVAIDEHVGTFKGINKDGAAILDKQLLWTGTLRPL